MRLAVKQRRFDLQAVLVSNSLCDPEMSFVDLCQPAVDDLLVQLFLLLKTKHFGRLVGQHAGDAIEGDVVEIRIEGRDHLDRHAPVTRQR